MTKPNFFENPIPAVKDINNEYIFSALKDACNLFDVFKAVHSCLQRVDSAPVTLFYVYQEEIDSFGIRIKGLNWTTLCTVTRILESVDLLIDIKLQGLNIIEMLVPYIDEIIEYNERSPDRIDKFVVMQAKFLAITAKNIGVYPIKAETT